MILYGLKEQGKEKLGQKRLSYRIKVDFGAEEDHEHTGSFNFEIGQVISGQMSKLSCKHFVIFLYFAMVWY